MFALPDLFTASYRLRLGFRKHPVKVEIRITGKHPEKIFLYFLPMFATVCNFLAVWWGSDSLMLCIMACDVSPVAMFRCESISRVAQLVAGWQPAGEDETNLRGASRLGYMFSSQNFQCRYFLVRFPNSLARFGSDFSCLVFSTCGQCK